MQEYKVTATIDGREVPISFASKPTGADVDAAIAQWRKSNGKKAPEDRQTLGAGLAAFGMGGVADAITGKPAKPSNSMPLANVKRGKDAVDVPRTMRNVSDHADPYYAGMETGASKPHTWRENVDAVNKVIHDVHDTATDWAIKNLHGSDTGASQFFLGGGIDKAIAGHGAGALAGIATAPLDVLGDAGVAVSPDAPLRDRGGAILNVGLKTVVPGMLGKGGKAAIEALKAGRGAGQALKAGAGAAFESEATKALSRAGKFGLRTVTQGKTAAAAGDVLEQGMKTAKLSKATNFGLNAGKAKLHPDVAPPPAPKPVPEEVPGATFRKPKVHEDVAPKVQPREPIAQEPVQPMQVPVQEPIHPTDQTFTGSRHSETDAIRAKLGWPERTKEGTSVQAILDQSKSKVEEAVHIADNAAKEGRPLSDIEQGAVGIKLAELDGQLPKLRAEMDAAIGTPEYAVKEAKVSEAESQLRTLVKANEAVGTEWGKSGRIRQLEIADDFTESGIYRQMFKKKVDPAKLGDKFIEENAAKVAEKDAQIADLQQQLVEANAGKVAKETAKKSKGLTREAIHAERQQIYAELDNILKEGLAKTHSIGSVAYDATRLGGTVGKLAVNYMKEGVVTLEEVVAKVIADLRGKGIEATREDVLNAVDQTGKPAAPRSELEKQYAKLKAEAKRLSESGQARAEGKRLADLNKQIAELRAQIKPGVKLPTPENKAIKKMSDAVKNAQAERDLLAAEVRNRIEAARPKGAWEKAGNLYGTVKSIRASTDISAPGRQGWILTLTNPKGAPGAFADQMQALASPKAAAIVQRDILDRSNLPLYKRANLFIAPFDGHGSAAGEELFRGHSLGGWDKGNFLNASDRAYAAYLNRVRVDSMDNFIKWVGKDANDPSLKLLGNYVNVSAGRGTILDVASAARLLNNAFFSPRYVASRLEYLIGMPMWDPRFGWKGTGKARLIIAKEYAKFVGAMGSVLALAKASGAEVNTDPTSTDYLKIKIGDTRIDMLAGLQQFMVIGSRLGLGKVTDSKGNSYKIEDAKYGQAQTGELLQRFFRSKSHPVIGTAWSLRDGKDYVGQPYDAKQAAQDLILPMSPQQLIEGLRKDGWDKDDAIGLLSFLGFGVQTFKKDETAKSRP